MNSVKSQLGVREGVVIKTSSFSVDCASVTDPQNYNLITRKIEDDSVIANSESICSKFVVRKLLGISQRVFFITKKGS